MLSDVLLMSNELAICAPPIPPLFGPSPQLRGATHQRGYICGEPAAAGE